MRWAFLAGTAFGTLLFWGGYFNGLLDERVFWLLPRRWLTLIDELLPPLCSALGRPDLCDGLGFDGGPLEWLDWSWIAIAPGLLYGLLGCALLGLVRFVRRPSGASASDSAGRDSGT